MNVKGALNFNLKMGYVDKESEMWVVTSYASNHPTGPCKFSSIKETQWYPFSSATGLVSEIRRISFNCWSSPQVEGVAIIPLLFGVAVNHLQKKAVRLNWKVKWQPSQWSEPFSAWPPFTTPAAKYRRKDSSAEGGSKLLASSSNFIKILGFLLHTHSLNY